MAHLEWHDPDALPNFFNFTGRSQSSHSTPSFWNGDACSSSVDERDTTDEEMTTNLILKPAFLYEQVSSQLLIHAKAISVCNKGWEEVRREGVVCCVSFFSQLFFLLSSHPFFILSSRSHSSLLTAHSSQLSVSGFSN